MTEDQFCKLHNFVAASKMTGYLDDETIKSFREIMAFFVQYGGVSRNTEGEKPVKPIESIVASIPVKRRKRGKDTG